MEEKTEQLVRKTQQHSMKRLVLMCFTSLLLFLCGTAQTQQGYVKTRGRLVNGSVVAGQRLSGATVQVKGRNAVVTNANGAFSFPMPANKFSIQSVKKQGYVLNDPEILSKQFSYSSDPLILVLEVPSQQAEDKLATERKLRRTLSRQLQQREDEIERLKEQNRLTEEQYHQALQELFAEQEKSLNLVSQMAERYAKIDFDQIDEFNRRVSECIIEGRLTEADSLIKSKGDLKERIATHNKHHEANVEARKHLEDSEAMEIKNREDLAEDCYNQFIIHKLQHHPDSAAYYIEQRALLDTTNVDWLYDAACYLKDIGNVDKALSLFLKAHNQYVTLGVNDNHHAEILETIADIYYDIDDKSKAKCYYNLAIDAFEEINALHPHLVHCYDFLSSTIIYTMKTNEKVWDAFEGTKINMPKGEDYYKYLFFGSNFILDHIYNSADIDINYIYFEDGGWSSSVNYNKAVQYHERALAKVDSVYGSNSILAAKIHKSLGKAYRYSHNLDKSMENYEMASTILNAIDSLNPELSDLYGMMADFCFRAQKDITAAIHYYQQAIHVLKTLFGNHQKIGRYYESLGGIYNGQKEYQAAIECYKKALDNDNRIYGEKSDWIIQINSSISSTYRNLSDFGKAIEYLQVNKSIIDQRLEWNSSRDKTSQYSAYYRELGDIYFLQKDYSSALDAYLNKIDVHTIEYGEKGIDIWEDYGVIGSIYLCQGDTIKALEYYVKSLEMFKADKWAGFKGIDDNEEQFYSYYIQHDYYQALSSFVVILDYLKRRSEPFFSFSASRILKMIKHAHELNE